VVRKVNKKRLHRRGRRSLRIKRTVRMHRSPALKKRRPSKRPARRTRPRQRRRAANEPRRRADRKIMLVIDHFVPHYDRDTGSRSLYHYLRLFTQMGLEVKFYGADGIRHQPYTSELERQGIEVLNGRIQDGDMTGWLRRHRRDLKVVYLLRPHIAEIYMGRIRKHTQAKIIYNGVDFHYVRELRRYMVDGDPAALASAQRYREQEFRHFAGSDVVYTVSEYEKALLEQEMPGKRVAAIPTYVYEGPFPLGSRNEFEDRSGILFVGGFAHQPNADGIHWFAADIFPRIAQALPDAKLTIIGSNTPEAIAALGGERIHVAGSVTDEELAASYAASRIVIAPLRYGAGVKGKIIEAVAHGVPVVTTPVGAEGIAEASGIAAIADSPARFAELLIELYRDEERWQAMRDSQIHYAQRYLSPDYALSILIQDIGGY